MDGASGWPLPERGNRTCLELAHTPCLDGMASNGLLGRARTIPNGMEPGSAPACMSVIGYDPAVYYMGRSAIEARSIGVPVAGDEVTFRCNLVTVLKGRMVSHSAGHITTAEASALLTALNDKIGSETIRFFPGINYRNILRLSGAQATLKAVCTPPHDITDRAVAEYLPHGNGSELLLELMKKSEQLLADHPVNVERNKNGRLPATMVWLFWGSGSIPDMPPFRQVYGLSAALTSGVDLLRGLGMMAGMELLDIDGVTDGLDNDFAAQAAGALAALETHDLVVMHIEAPDEMGHRGSVEDKIRAIEMIDKEVLSRLVCSSREDLRIMVMPDHPTPIKLKTHSNEAVPFLIWGSGINGNCARRFTEKEAIAADILIDPGYKLMERFVRQ